MVRSRQFLVLLLLAAAVAATARTFGFTIGASEPAACLSIGNTTYRLAPHGARADYAVRVDSAAPSPGMRIRMVDNADEADFVFIDDGDRPAGCQPGSAVTRSVTTDPARAAPDLIVGLAAPSTPADYRIFVRSRWLSAEAAAALFAAAHIPARTLADNTRIR